jgi:uncharacterized membrane protein YjgN (DUF898 family)
VGLFLFIQLFAFFPTATAATSLWDSQVGKTEMGSAFGSSDNPTDIRIVVANIIRVFLSFLGIIFLVLIVWAGYRWMMAAGNEQTITEAKAQITNAVIGLIIVMFAYAIAFYVTECIFDVTTANSLWMCKP